MRTKKGKERTLILRQVWRTICSYSAEEAGGQTLGFFPHPEQMQKPAASC